MHAMNKFQRYPIIVAICLLAGSGVGCKKMLAKYSLGKAQKRVEQAQEYKADQYVPDLLEQTNQLINTAQSQLNTENYTEARTTAKQAAERSEELLARSKQQRAQDLKEQAYKWIDIARTNQGEQEDPRLFQQIVTDNQEGLKQFDEENYEEAVNTFGGVVDDVHFLLQNLRESAQNALAETRQMKQTLIDEDAEQYAPEKIEQMTQHIQQIEQLIEQQNNYREALSARDQARQTLEEGIRQTKEAKSHEQLLDIENLLDQATSLGAEVYAQQSFNAVTKDFENLLEQFYAGNYDTVLASTPVLKPKVQDLIVETKRESARARMEAVQQAINRLVDGKAPQYLPGRVEELRQMLEEARAKFEQDQYQPSEQVSQRALDLRDQIMDEFDGKAESAINTAADSVSTAQQVFQRMKEEGVFTKQIDGDWTGEDQALENSKQALQQELSSILNNAQLSLGTARLKREETSYHEAITIAGQAREEAEHVRQQTYRVVAHNAVLELSNQLTRYEVDGGRLYAAQPLEQTYELLNQTKQLLRQEGQYREAVRRAADTKAQLEVLVQRLEQVANERLEQARRQIAEARGARADTYEREILSQAIASMEVAAGALEQESLKQAIESANKAEQIAMRATRQALDQWAQDEMDHTRLLIEKARQAGAERFAPDQLGQSVELLRQVEQLYEQTALREAIDMGQRASQIAHDALYARVNQAESIIARAKRFQGWRYSHEKLAQAIVSAKNAREALEDAQYTLSEQHAVQAMETARTVIEQTQHRAFQHNMEQLRAQIEEAERQGAGYYQIRDLSRIMADMDQLRKQFSPQTYEQTIERMNQLEARLAGLMEHTPEVLEELVLAMQNRMGELEEQGAADMLPGHIERLENHIKYAQLDFSEEQYHRSYENIRKAQELLNEIGLALEEREFDARLTRLLKDFRNALQSFEPVLNLGSATMIRMSEGATGRSQAVALMTATPATQMHTEIGEVAKQVRTLEPPRTRERLKELTIQMLGVADTASANFEKFLILDQYNREDAMEIIQAAYMQMYEARRMQRQIQQLIEHPVTEFQPIGVERVTSSVGR